MAISPWLVVGVAGLGVLGVVAYKNRGLEDAVPARAVLREGVHDRKTSRALGAIDRRKEVLDERYLRLRDTRQAAEARATAATTPRARKSALVSVQKLRDREELVHRQADRLEVRYGGIESGQIRVNPSTDPELAAAMSASERFHGTPYEVVELSPAEQRVSKYVVVLGEQPELDYEPDSHSGRGNTIWTHALGDRGDFLPKGPGKALLAWDIQNRKPVTVMMGSEINFSPSVGLEG